MFNRLDRLTLEDIQALDSPESVADLFRLLNYTAIVQPLAIERLELPTRSASAIEKGYLIADYRQENQSLQILLFEFNPDEFSTLSLAKNRMRMIANSLCTRPSLYLLIGTVDYKQLLVSSPQQALDDQLNLVIKMESCYINCACPSYQERNWLEKLSANRVSPQMLHNTQHQALRNAAIVQKAALEPYTEDSIHLYLREIGRIPLLTRRQEIELTRKVFRFQQLEQVREDLSTALGREPTNREWAAATDIPLLAHRIGLKARNKLIAANLRLVVSIAKRYQGRGVDLMDLVQEGNIGLFRASEKFDPERGYKFSTYATWWIRQGVTRAIANQARLIRLPVHVNEKLTDIKRVNKLFIQRVGRQPTDTEIATTLNISLPQLRSLLRSAQPPVSLDISTNEDGSSHLGDLIDANMVSAEVQLTQQHLRKDIDETLKLLTPRESQVIKLKFGLVDGEERSLAEIGRIYNLSRERIRQIEAKALEKLRRPQFRTHLRDYIR